MSITRGKYQGVLQIVRFNWPMYVVAAVILIAGTALTMIAPLPTLVRAFIHAGLGLAGFWLILSLLVSHYVYDRSALYRGEWLRCIFPSPPSRSATLHVGLDEFSEILREHFPQSESVAIDFFDATEMTEPSIRRARAENAIALSAATRADFRALPFRDDELDVACLIFAAHELRRTDSRRRLFRELARVLKPRGKILLVEHLRDLANFLAFGPGCFHFHSRATWLQAFADTGLSTADEFHCTPVVRVLVFEKV
jgi:ubiquinone/menaquinone biosynthesis C-methylase UbiE